LDKDNDKIGEKTSQVAEPKKQWMSIGILIVVLILVYLLWSALSSKPDDKAKRLGASDSLMSQHDNILQQNAARLKLLENMKQQKQIETVILGKSNESKELTMRRHAPSQVYGNSHTSKVTTANLQPSSDDNVIADSNDPYAKFANSQSSSSSLVKASIINHPDRTIAQGELIHAVLETAINSDLPGMVRAVVAEPVYSYVGGFVLLPKGSRLIGQYASLSGNSAATSRVFAIWNRVITPKGVSVMINSPSANQLGAMGQSADSINTHFWKIFGNATLISLIGAGTANLGVDNNDQTNSSDAYRQAIADSFQQTAGRVLKQGMNIAPTLSIHQGARINVFVAKDLQFEGV